MRVDWLRDVAPYLLFAMAPFFALDAQRAFSRRALVRLLVIGGLVATAWFSTHWLEVRNIANLPFSQFALSSFFFFGRALRLCHRGWLAPEAAPNPLARLGCPCVRAPRGYRNAFDSDPRRSSSSRHNRCSSQSRRSLCSARLARPSSDPRDRGAGGLGSSGDACVYGDHQQARCDLEEQWHLEWMPTTSTVRRRRTPPVRSSMRIRSSARGPARISVGGYPTGLRRSEFILDSPMDFPAKFGLAGVAIVLFLVRFSVRGLSKESYTSIILARKRLLWSPTRP